MNNIFNSGLILSTAFALMVASIPYNEFALVESNIGNSKDIVYVSASPSSDNTTGESSGGSGIESSTVVSLVTISKSKGPGGNIVINPPTTTIKTGGEILIFNNDTAAHTIKSGTGPSDPLAGRLFGAGPIQPKGYIEYVASNLQPGTYPFYSTHDPSIKGELVVTN